MLVPAVIEDVLKQYNINSGLTEAAPETFQGVNPGAAKTMVLQDKVGKLQVIYSADSILDIDALCQLTGRQLRAIDQNDVQALYSKAHLERLPVLPTALGLEMVIDQQLLEATELTLDTGSKHRVINVNNLQFQELIGSATTGHIAICESQLQSTTLDDVDDIEQITSAVANFTQLRIKRRLEETLQFPPLSGTAQKIIKLRVDPHANIEDLTRIVEQDPSLAAQVVSWAASPYYAAPGKIKSVHDAIVRVLGFDLVLNLSLGLSLGKSLSLPSDGVSGFTSYWRQSVYAATAVEALIGAIPPKHRPTMGLAYLCGLLHNFGYLILAELFPPHFSKICRFQEANPYTSHCYIDRHLINITREQLGSWLMSMWNMPEEVCIALRQQSESSYDGEHHAYANITFVAMHLLRQQGIGDAPLTAIPDELFEQLNLDREKAIEAIANVMESVDDLNQMASNLSG